MRTLDEIVEFLDAFLRVKELGEDTGLVLGGRKGVEKVAGAVDLSLYAVEQAKALGCDLLFSHHAAWRSTDADLVEEKHKLIRDAGMSLYVSHDPLDVHAECGTAISLARVLNWEVTGRFCRGLGILAKAPGNLSLTDLEKDVSGKIQSRLRVVKSSDEVGLIGIVTGWGARPEWMSQARRKGADTFLSGEGIHFGKLYARESGMNLILAGHYSTELPAVRCVLERINQECNVKTVTVFDQGSADLF